jgi:hypothetical protein
MTKPPKKPDDQYPDADKRRDDALRRALNMPPKPKKAKKNKKAKR